MALTKRRLHAFAVALVFCLLCVCANGAYADEASGADTASQAPTATATANDSGSGAAGDSNAGQATVQADNGGSAAVESGDTATGGQAADGDASGTDGADAGASATNDDANAGGTAENTAADGTADASAGTADTTAAATTDATAATDAAAATDATTAAAATATTATAATTAKKASSNAPIADGTYIMNLDLSKTLVAAIAGSSKKNHAYVQMTTDSNAASQQWVFTWVEKYGAYTIKNVNSGLYVTLKSVKSGKKLVYQAKLTSNSNKRQLWVLSQTGDGYKILSKAKTSLGLGTWSGKAKSGYYITTQKASSKKFKYYLLPVDESLKEPTSTVSDSLDGKFVNISLASKTSLNVSISGEAVDAQAASNISSSSTSQSQKWYLECVSKAKGLYKIVNLGSGKVLQSAGKYRHVNTAVVQNTNSTGIQQQWWISKNSDGTYQFKNRFNGLILTASSATSGTALTLTNAPAKSNREFKVSETTAIPNGWYEVLLNASTTQALTVPSSSSSSGVQLVAKKYDSNLNQKFKFTKISDAIYSIMAVCSNRYLADSSGKVVQSAKNANDSTSQWRLVWKTTAFALQNVGTGYYLFANDSAKDSAKITTTSSYKGTANLVTPVRRHIIDNGAYYIKYGKSGSTVLGVAESDVDTSKAKLKSFTKANASNLRFKFTYLSTSNGREIYRIDNVASGMSLTSSGTSLYQQAWASNNSQRWTLSIADDGGLAFVNVATGKAISNASSTKTTATYDMNSTTYTGTASSENSWALEATSGFTTLQQVAYNKLIKTTSKTNYALIVDLKHCYMFIFTRASKSSPWTLKYEWRCSVGSKKTPTPVVNILSTGYKRSAAPKVWSNGKKPNTSFYYLTWLAKGRYIHTPLYKKGSKTVYADKRIGYQISNGCIRLHDENAIWVYKNIKKGTRMITYNK